MTAGPSQLRHVVIVGLMGSGKTTVGSALAERLGWLLSDSDVVLQVELGQTVRAWRNEAGTDALHAVEADHLRAALAAPVHSVITPAASTIDQADCRVALTAPDILVVWLRADPLVLAARFERGTHRPAYGPVPARFLADQAATRDPGFASVADLVLDTDDRPVAEVVDAIVGRIHDPTGAQTAG